MFMEMWGGSDMIHNKSAKYALLMGICLLVFSGPRARAYTMPAPGDFIDTAQKTEVDCDAIRSGRTMVALVFGQSNSANHGETRYMPRGNVYNFFDGKCYKATDPMLGATGDRGSVWSRLGDKLIDAGLYDNVIFISIGVGGTEIRRWTVNGDLHRRIVDVVHQLKKEKMKITHVFWHQGESDASRKTTKDEYKSMFMAMLEKMRKYGIDAPIYVAVATRCGSGAPGYEIQQAQRELVNTDLEIFPGPYTDEITSIEDRHDACHFSDRGLDKHADMWLRAVMFTEKK